MVLRAKALTAPPHICNRGSFAVVKEGRHIATNTPVAIKIVDKKDAVFDPESLEQEVSCLTFDNSPHLCLPASLLSHVLSSSLSLLPLYFPLLASSSQFIGVPVILLALLLLLIVFHC